MCLGPAPQPSTQKAASYQKLICVFMLLLLPVIVLDFVAGEFIAGFFGILMLLVLYLARRQMGHQLVMIYIFFSLYFFILFLVDIFTPVQNEDKFAEYTNKQLFDFIVYIISCLFYLISAVVFFYPYREFKAVAFSQNPALEAYFNSGSQGDQNDNKGKKADNQEPASYNPDYGDFNYEEQKPAKNRGQFQVFQGQGVRIG